ncbi:hypothetical protein, partial [Nonomuraea terrae]|uniref:hypothetical protein n=1 Tax=Nonomuraea terrae TaxID=2530383 RepID=UPI001FE3EF81
VPGTAQPDEPPIGPPPLPGRLLGRAPLRRTLIRTALLHGPLIGTTPVSRTLIDAFALNGPLSRTARLRGRIPARNDPL